MVRDGKYKRTGINQSDITCRCLETTNSTANLFFTFIPIFQKMQFVKLLAQIGLLAAVQARTLKPIPVRQISTPGPAQDPQYVKVKGISVLGSGCPPGSADVQIDATGTLFEVTFSAYEVQTGPDTKPADWRKNCKLTINMEFTSGFQSVTVSI